MVMVWTLVRFTTRAVARAWYSTRATGRPYCHQPSDRACPPGRGRLHGCMKASEEAIYRPLTLMLRVEAIYRTQTLPCVGHL